jgi:hypothetical protein
MNRQLDSYVKSLIPEPYIILGIELKPLCLGHIFLMKRFECGFASEDPNYTGGIDDLLLGLSICSRTYEEFIEFIRDIDKFQEWSREWGLAIKKQIKKEKPFDLFSRFQLFKDYLKAGIIIPKYWENENSDDDRETGTHWTQTVLHVLMSDIGYSQSEALNIPVSRALHEYFRYLEKNGAVTLMTDDDLEIIDKAEEKEIEPT